MWEGLGRGGDERETREINENIQEVTEDQE